MVQGVEALRQRFAAIIPKVERDVLVVIERGQNRVASTVRTLAPKDEGRLAASVKVTPFARSLKGKPYKGFRVTYGNASTKVALRGGTATINNVILQEFGTLDMPASPAFFPAYRANRKSIRAAMTRAYREAMKRA
ncbi:MAG: HK97-gp10 family putative phage morphogenesis protein [Deltaproteobacteria bacterium]